jgi:hypothetical protein
MTFNVLDVSVLSDPFFGTARSWFGFKAKEFFRRLKLEAFDPFSGVACVQKNTDKDCGGAPNTNFLACFRATKRLKTFALSAS